MGHVKTKNRVNNLIIHEKAGWGSEGTQLDEVRQNEQRTEKMISGWRGVTETCNMQRKSHEWRAEGRKGGEPLDVCHDYQILQFR